jgi:hypothetical protein
LPGHSSSSAASSTERETEQAGGPMALARPPPSFGASNAVYVSESFGNSPEKYRGLPTIRIRKPVRS